MGRMQIAQKPVGPLAAYVEEIWYCDGHGRGDHKQRVLPNGKLVVRVTEKRV